MDHHGADDMQSEYTPPLGLTIISSISIGIAGLVALWIMLDIIWRKGWKTMMAIMYEATPSAKAVILQLTTPGYPCTLLTPCTFGLLHFGRI